MQVSDREHGSPGSNGPGRAEPADLARAANVGANTVNWFGTVDARISTVEKLRATLEAGLKQWSCRRRSGRSRRQSFRAERAKIRH